MPDSKSALPVGDSPLSTFWYQDAGILYWFSIASIDNLSRQNIALPFGFRKKAKCQHHDEHHSYQSHFKLQNYCFFTKYPIPNYWYFYILMSMFLLFLVSLRTNLVTLHTNWPSNIIFMKRLLVLLKNIWLKEKIKKIMNVYFINVLILMK